ncbi:MAG: PAS domain S-box protein [Cyclobacteriaceae bacterium]
MPMGKPSDSSSTKDLEDQIAQLERRVIRERNARKQAEALLESKSLELYNSNKSLELSNLELEKQLARNEEFLKSFNDFSSYLVGKNNLTEIATIVSEKLISKYDLEHCVIYLVSEDYCEQVSAYDANKKSQIELDDPIKIEVGTGIIGTVAQTGQSILINDTTKDDRYIAPMVAGLSELTVPIIYEGTVIGIIDSEHSQKDFFDESHLKTISTISSLISVLFKNSITEKKNINLQYNFEKRTETLNSLVHNLHSGLLLNDENGKIILINEVFREIFNFSIPMDEIMGADQRDSANLVKYLFSDPDEFIEIIDYCRENNTEVTNKELSMKNGTILDCDFIPIYSQNEFIGQLWQVTDVTESRIASKNLQASEEKYRGIIENMELGLLEVDTNHIILKAYDRFCQMTGYTQEELIGQNAREIFLPENHSEIMDEQDDMRSQGEQSIYEVQLRRKNGELIWVLISGAPFYNMDGEIGGTIGIHYNITERKKLEEDLRFSKLQTEKAIETEKQFLANMSHEIRNPLNAIIGITNLLYDTKPSQKQLEHLNKIKYSSDILLGLISGILDISKIDSGKIELHEKEVDVYEVVNGLIQIAGFNDHNRKIDYINNLSFEGEFAVKADPTILNQIFLNLLNNATKFTESGSIKVEGSIVSRHEDYNVFEFCVSDTGIGIPQDKLKTVFDKFQQADNETKLKYGGTGLGLNIVKQLVNRYGGDIWAESKMGEGTNIYFSLKLRHSSEGMAKSDESKYELKDFGKILVVEDNDMNQYYLSGILNKWQIQHDTADDGFQALEALEENSYRLILMDIRMPGMNGYETTIKLRAMKHNVNSNIPVIALTASALVDEREKALQAGMNYHLTKPYTEDDLGKALMKFGVIKEVASDTEKEYSFSEELDVKYLEECYQNDLERASIMFGIFDRTIDSEMTRLKSNMEINDWNGVSAVAHKIKPNFAMVGLTSLFKTMEKYESSKKYIEVQEDIKQNFSKLESELFEGKLLVKKEIEKMNQYLKA